MDKAIDMVIRLATPETCGSGFYLAKYDLIVTAEHIIRGFNKVIIETDEIPRQLAEVVYTDAILDIAVLRSTSPLDIVDVPFDFSPKEGESVYAMSAPFGSQRQKIEGIIKDLSYDFHGQPHISHTATLGNECNGCPLFSQQKKLVGLNHFIRRNSSQIGVALPLSIIISTIEEFEALNTKFATRCEQCNKLVGGPNIDNCVHCGSLVSMPYKNTEVIVSGVCKTIENLLESMGYTLSLSRIGPDHWELLHGSAAINITYYEKNGLIIGDAYMCKLPQLPNQALFEYLLRQNQEMKNLTFSVKDEDIILSLLIYDRYLNKQTGTELLTKLLDKADFYDNILVSEYKCLWVSSRKL